MAALEGEQLLLTVYADVHYYFHKPCSRPQNHRFDKGSYLYLYGQINRSSARVEIANHVGTVEQDAVTGSLNVAIIEQSYRHQTLCSISVHGAGLQQPELRQSLHDHWTLANTDARHGSGQLLQLHTVDIYFWTDSDANKFMSNLRSYMHPRQLLLLDQPVPSAHMQDGKISSRTIQQLEHMAIQKPGLDTTGTSRLNKAAPPAAVQIDTTSTATPFVTMAYNPAAPGKPETIREREKTPPPVDGSSGTGLSAAALADQAATSGSTAIYDTNSSCYQVTSSQAHQPQSSPSTPYLPNGTPSQSSQQPLPPPPPLSRQHVGQTGGALEAKLPNVNMAFAPPPTQPLALPLSTNSVASRVQHTNPTDHNALHDPYKNQQQPRVDMQNGNQHHTTSPDTQATIPVGGYSNYSYAANSHNMQDQQQASAYNNYQVHNQLYRPTPEESGFTKRKPSSASQPDLQPTGPGRVDAASKLDKGVSRFLKKIEKRIG